MLSCTIIAWLLIAQASATSPPKNWKQAQASVQRFRGKVLNETLQPNWFDEGRKFWYVARRPDGKKEHVIVDISSATKTVVMESEIPKDAKPAEVPPRAQSSRSAFQEPRPQSPDGKWETFTRDCNLWLRERKTKREQQLSFEGNAADAYRGECYWSPDSKRLAALRTRAGGSRKITIVESSPREQVQPLLKEVNYLKPGDAIDQPRLVLFEIDPFRQVIIDNALFANPWSLGRFRWDTDSCRFTFLYNQRGHQVMRVLAVNAADGGVTTIINEECPTFFDYSNKTYLRHLKDGSLLWMSERSGRNHLYRIDGNTGEVLNAVTGGDYIVRGVDHIDEAAGHIWLRILGHRDRRDPYFSDLARVGLDGSGFTLLTDGDGTHEVQWSPDRRAFIDTWSRLDQPPVHVLRDADGRQILELERAVAAALKAAGWKPHEPFALPGRNGETLIHGYIVWPSHFDPEKKYPVIESIYAGPHNFFCTKQFKPVLYESTMAELGFIVVKMDGMGTNWRTKAFHDVCWQNLSDAGLPDRIAVIKALAEKHPAMDISRGVGIYGGSAGGQSTLAALLHHGDFYTVGVADCGCHDNRMDKIWWNEAWMGWPVGPHYAEQSNVTHARKLKGKLMLIVGETDTNVDPASTMQVVDALVRADKDFDLLIMPGVGHGAAEHPYAARRRAEFFLRHLPPPLAAAATAATIPVPTQSPGQPD